MKSKKVFGLLLILTIFIYAFRCEVYEDNAFITLQGKITDESNQDVPGLELVLGQEFWYYSSESKKISFEFDTLEWIISRRISIGKTDDSGNFKFVHPAMFTSFYVYKNPQTFFRYLEKGIMVERNYILFERDPSTGKFRNEFKDILIVNP